MPAGHDFDALLMGALYGELSAVEESRLQAHLAAHPADQQIFHDLTRIREAIRAGVATVVVEPPQAISALLLQEAARRAPKSTIAAGSADGPGRWMKWLSSLLAHPGLAAAAMLTVVVGVAGTMYLRGGAKLAESTQSVTATSESAPAPPSGAAQADGAAMREPSVTATAGMGSGDLAARQPQKTPDRGPADSPQDLQAQLQTSDQLAQREAAYSVALDNDVGAATGSDVKRERPADLRRGGAPDAKPQKRDYIEAKPVDEVKLKDFDDATDRAELAKESKDAKAAQRKRAAEDDLDMAAADAEYAEPPPPAAPAAEAQRADVRGQKGGNAVSESEKNTVAPRSVTRSAPPPSANAVSGAAPAAAPGSAPMPASSPASIPAPVTAPTTPSVSSKADTSVARKPAPTTAAAPKPAEITTTASSTADSSAAPADKKSAVDEAWAKGEHARLLRLAKANQCSEAASIAGVIALRAPRYYQDHVATDTKLRVCQAAIRDQLNLQSEQSKRRKSPARANEAAPAPDKK